MVGYYYGAVKKLFGSSFFKGEAFVTIVNIIANSVTRFNTEDKIPCL